jgi:hypothetical protein
MERATWKELHARKHQVHDDASRSPSKGFETETSSDPRELGPDGNMKEGPVPTG